LIETANAREPDGLGSSLNPLPAAGQKEAETPSMKTGFIALTAFVLLVTGGCGYHFTGEGPGPRPGLKRISIPVFKNNTSEPELGAILAGALRREFMKRGNMQLVSSEEAEAVFWGTVTNIYATPVAHRELPITYGKQLAVETRLYVVLDIRCVDPGTGKVLWQDPSFTYFRVYQQVPDPDNPSTIVSFDNRRQALEVISREMAVRIHDRFLSNF